MAELFVVIVKKPDGTTAKTQLSISQINDVLDSGGKVFIRKYKAEFTNPDGSTFTSGNFLTTQEISFIGLPFVLKDFRDDEIFAGFGLPIPSDEPVPDTSIITPTPTPIEPTPSTLDPLPTTELITISSTFTIENGRILGKVLLIVTPEIFTVFPNIPDIKQLLLTTTFNTIPLTTSISKTNELFFSSAERDELIFYNEEARGSEIEARMVVFNTVSGQIFASKSNIFGISVLVPPEERDFLPPTITTTPTLRAPIKIDSTFGKIIAGVFIGGVAIAALGSRRKK